MSDLEKLEQRVAALERGCPACYEDMARKVVADCAKPRLTGSKEWHEEHQRLIETGRNLAKLQQHAAGLQCQLDEEQRKRAEALERADRLLGKLEVARAEVGRLRGERHSWCATHKYAPMPGAPCWQCANPHIEAVKKRISVMHRILDRPEFRGLWRSRCVHPDGSVEEGWSVTFRRCGEYCEVPYQKTAVQACREALRIMEE